MLISNSTKSSPVWIIVADWNIANRTYFSRRWNDWNKDGEWGERERQRGERQKLTKECKENNIYVFQINLHPDKKMYFAHFHLPCN